MRNYIHIIKNLPGILARIESELQSKASSTSVAALTARLGQKADIKATGDSHVADCRRVALPVLQRPAAISRIVAHRLAITDSAWIVFRFCSLPTKGLEQ